MGITILPPWRFCFLIFFSFCLLTVQLHFTPILNFKQSTHAQKKSVFILFLSIIYIIIYIHFIIIIIFFFRKQTTHTHAHTKSSLGMLLIFLFYGLLPCCLVGVNLFVTIFLCSIFVSRSFVDALPFQRL